MLRSAGCQDWLLEIDSHENLTGMCSKKKINYYYYSNVTATNTHLPIITYNLSLYITLNYKCFEME
jgi:hypothetical protein